MISLVAAIDEDGIIGDSTTNSIPWNCAVDQELFRRLTWGADVVVGRRTWESWRTQYDFGDIEEWVLCVLWWMGASDE